MIQRHILLLILLCNTLFLLACTVEQGENVFNEDKMYTLTGKKIVLKNRNDIYTNQEFGFGFVVPKIMLNLLTEKSLQFEPDSQTVSLITFYSGGLLQIIEAFDPSTSTDEEWDTFRSEAEKYTFSAGLILRVPPEAERNGEAELLEYIKTDYAVVEEIARLGKTAYYFAYNTDYSTTILTDTEKTQVNAVIAELKDFTKNIFVFPPILYPQPILPDMTISLKSFKTQSLDGDTITQSIFEDYALTMVTIWTTSCETCISQMPDLTRLHKTMLPDNANMITILADGLSGIEKAHEIINSSSAEFITLLPHPDLTPLLNTVTTVPTTIFVDSKGVIMSESLLGAPEQNIAEVYLSVIERLLLEQ